MPCEKPARPPLKLRRKPLTSEGADIMQTKKARKPAQRYHVEFTDTFGGEANYCFVRRFAVNASTLSGAARVAARHLGYSRRIVAHGSWGDGGRWNIRGAALCFFVECGEDCTTGQVTDYPLVNGRDRGEG